MGQRLLMMQSALLHRGPDDRGVFQSAQPNGGAWGGVSCGLVHTRLSILDLSPAGHQPMTFSSGGLSIVFNGEIYNFKELKAQLTSMGETGFVSNSDTEILLRLFKQFGPACLEKLRGMFAFAIWDDKGKTLFLARDPLGIKPLYYSFQDGRLVFASELRAIMASGLVQPEPDPTAIYHYFRTGTVAEPATLLRGVRMLEAGHWLCWKEEKIDVRNFWQLKFSNDDDFNGDAVQLVRSALLDSVNSHFVSDVPVGIFLSGGIDSTALVALAKCNGHEKLESFTIGFNESNFDETDLAARTAKHFGTSHHSLKVDAATGRDLFQRYLRIVDQPSNDGLNTFSISEFARQNNLRVVLSGLGGDELFGGYPSFRRIPQMVKTARSCSFLKPILARVLGAAGGLSHNLQAQRLAEFLKSRSGPEEAYAAVRGVFTHVESKFLVRSIFAQELPEIIPSPVRGFSAMHLLDEVSGFEITRYMRNQVLRDSDVMSMACGLELRVPFIDRVLLETIARIPAQLRLRPGKLMLLEAVPEIPEWISSRPKRGFSFPFQQWLGHEWKTTFEKSTKDTGLYLGSWYRTWALFMLQHCLERLRSQALIAGRKLSESPIFLS